MPSYPFTLAVRSILVEWRLRAGRTALSTRVTASNPEIAMPLPPLLPKSEALRRAVAWLAEQRSWTPELIDQASQRFDLSPRDEEFLLQESRRFHKQYMPPAND